MRTKNETNAAIGLRIKEIRENRKITQEQLAEKIEICSASQVSDIERGLSGVSVGKLMDICKTLNVPSDYLLFGKVSETISNPMNEYLEKMTAEQLKCAEEMIETYAKACGIK